MAEPIRPEPREIFFKDVKRWWRLFREVRWVASWGVFLVRRFVAPPLWWLWDFSGLRAVWLKFFPDRDPATLKGKQTRTGVLWVVGIYSALFGIASGRYESALDRIENRQSGIYAQLGSRGWREAIERIPSAQEITRPVQPDFWDPGSVFASMFGEQIEDDDNIEALKDVVVAFKKDLSGVKLNGAQLRGARLSNANLSGAHLFGADLSYDRRYAMTRYPPPRPGAADLSWANIENSRFNWTNLFHVDLSGAYLFSANLRGAALSWADLHDANLSEADLQDAGFSGADLQDADFSGADLGGADLRGVKNLTCEQLQKAENWRHAYRDDELACGAPIPEPPWESD